MARANEARVGISREQIEIAKCCADAAYFVHEYGQIDDPQQPHLGVLPFHLWPAQVRVMWQLMICRLVVILKARQLGISWLICGYALWLCLFNEGRVVLIFSKGQGEADEMLRRIEVLYDRLPDWMRAALPARMVANTREHIWANASRVESKAATKTAGRSLTASLTILDEFAFMLWATQLYTAAKPTIDAGGQMIVLSTADGIGNAFHVLWTQAKNKINGFKAIFLPYTARPGRDAAWREQKRRESLEPAKIPQEYPLTESEAFIASQRARFDRAWVEAQAANVRPALPVAALPVALQNIPGLSVWELPRAGVVYEIAADVAEGGEDGDFDDATVIRRDTMDEVAALRGRWEADIYGGYLAALGLAYNRARTTPERNNHGHTVILSLRNRGALIGVGHDGKPGWLTNTATKPQLIDAYAALLRDEAVTLRSEDAVREAGYYERKADGTTGAPSGKDMFGVTYHDDTVMSRSIAAMMLRRPAITGKKTKHRSTN